MRVWILDDSPMERRASERALAPTYDLEAFGDGPSLLERLAGGGDPDVLVLDWQLPGMTGVEVLRFVRQSRNELALPVLMVTGMRSGAHDLTEALEAGANDYVAKPVNPAELRARIRGLTHVRHLYRRARRSEQLARDSAARTRAILASLAEGVVIQDADGILSDVNRSAEEILGVTRDALLGRSSVDPRWGAVREDGSDMPGEEHPPMRAIASGAPQENVVMGVRRPDGALVWVQVHARPLWAPEAGAVIGVVSSFLDVTERRRHEAEARDRAEFERQLVGIVSHDLRTPIMAISLGAAVLAARPLPEGEARMVQRIVSSAQRATRMIHDLLDFTQARLGGGIPVRPQPLALGEVVRRVIDEVALAHPDRRIDLDAGDEVHGVWDADRVAQVLTNLLTNALQHSLQGTLVRVTTRGEGDAVTLDVHNHGEPIPPELSARMFAPMQRGPSLVSRSGHSVGLGLYIVEQIVRAHGGTVHVRSSGPEGTTFTVRLPLRGSTPPAG